MLKAINLNGKEYYLVKKNLGVFGNTDLIDKIRTVIDVRYNKEHHQDSFNLQFIFDDGRYECNYMSDDKITEEFTGNALDIMYILKNNIVIFNDSSYVNLHEVQYCDDSVGIDLFDGNKIPKPDIDAFENFVDELGVFIGDTLTDYNKIFVPVLEKDRWYIGCQDLESGDVIPLNQESDRIKDAVIFMCNALRISEKTKLVFLKYNYKEEYKLDAYSLLSLLDDDDIQYVYTCEEPVSLDNATKYNLREM